MLIEIAIGDAYGAAFEFVKKPYPNGLTNDGATYFKHPELQIGDGRYTDDTQMTLAIVEEIMEGGDFSKESLAQRFWSVYHRDPRQGYGKQFHHILQESTSGRDLLQLLNPTSTRSGACMRVVPLGLMKTVEEAMVLAEKQATVTHNSQEAIAASKAIAAASHYLFNGGSMDGLGYRLEALVSGYRWSAPYNEWATVEAIPVARAAISALSSSRSMSAVLKNAVHHGGDVDTVAAIALGLASVSKDHISDLPDTLYYSLENGPYGREYLTTLENKLIFALAKR